MDYPGIFALDCEMCSTTMGNELTRVTVINLRGKTVYESMVLPNNEIIDYNLEIHRRAFYPSRVVFKMDTLLLETMIESNYLCMLLKRVFISSFNQKHYIALTPKRLVLILSRRFDRESTIVNTRQ